MASLARHVHSSYASLDDAVAMIRLMGRGTKLVKVDLKDAYRIIPVHPSDYSVLGIAWKGKRTLTGHFRLGCVQPRKFSVQLPISLHGHYISRE